jgi:hypothetical protein
LEDAYVVAGQVGRAAKVIIMGNSYVAISLTSTLKWSGSRPTGAAQGDPSEFN